MRPTGSLQQEQLKALKRALMMRLGRSWSLKKTGGQRSWREKQRLVGRVGYRDSRWSDHPGLLSHGPLPFRVPRHLHVLLRAPLRALLRALVPRLARRGLRQAGRSPCCWAEAIQQARQARVRRGSFAPIDRRRCLWQQQQLMLMRVREPVGRWS